MSRQTTLAIVAIVAFALVIGGTSFVRGYYTDPVGGPSCAQRSDPRNFSPVSWPSQAQRYRDCLVIVVSTAVRDGAIAGAVGGLALLFVLRFRRTND